MEIDAKHTALFAVYAEYLKEKSFPAHGASKW